MKTTLGRRLDFAREEECLGTGAVGSGAASAEIAVLDAIPEESRARKLRRLTIRPQEVSFEFEEVREEVGRLKFVWGILIDCE